jgi:magnesium transporter
MTVKYLETKPAHPGYHEREGYKAGCWAIVSGPTAHELDDVAEQFNLSRSQLAHVRDREELPRLEFTDDATYLFIRHAYTSSRGERETSPLLMVLRRDALITIIPRPLAQDLKTDRASRTLRGTTLQVIGHVLDSYSVFLDEITHRIKSLRHSLHNHEISNQDLAYFVTLEEELNDFVSSLEPLNAILQRLVLAHHFPLTTAENETLGDLILENQQLLNASSTLLRSIESIRNAHGTIATNNLNRTMKILTIATVLLALPNVIFGSLGMNIPLPFRNEWWAYPVTIGGTFCITVAVYLFARKRRIF